MKITTARWQLKIDVYKVNYKLLSTYDSRRWKFYIVFKLMPKFKNLSLIMS